MIAGRTRAPTWTAGGGASAPLSRPGHWRPAPRWLGFLGRADDEPTRAPRAAGPGWRRCYGAVVVSSAVTAPDWGTAVIGRVIWATLLP